MSTPQDYISGYLDDVISPDDQARLADWLKESPQNAEKFAHAVMLHERLRGE